MHVPSALPKIESFRLDMGLREIRAAELAHIRSIASLAYLYALPAFINMRQVTEWIAGREQLSPGEPPFGGWVKMRELANPQTTNTLPNVDTLYAAAYLLLTETGPVVVSTPLIDDRYFSVAFLDAYFNNFAVKGTSTGDTGGANYLLTPPGWRGDVPEGMTDVIEAPTPMVNMYQRIFIRGAEEYQQLHALQDAITITPLYGWGTDDAALEPADLSAFREEGIREIADPMEFFKRACWYMGVNPPPAADTGLAALFATAGLGPDSAIPTDPERIEAICMGAADAQAAINSVTSGGDYRDGWKIPDPNVGIAGPYILTRAVYQLTQIASFPASHAIYLFSETLSGQGRYSITFPADALPPHSDGGFWSLTLYTKGSYLFDNPLERYALRPDSPGLTYGDDGSLTLYIQADKPKGVPEANWLPSDPAGFFMALRIYLPGQAVSDRGWWPAAIVRKD